MILFFKRHSFIPLGLFASFWQYDAVWVTSCCAGVDTHNRSMLPPAKCSKKRNSIHPLSSGRSKTKTCKVNIPPGRLLFRLKKKKRKRITSATETTKSCSGPLISELNKSQSLKPVRVPEGSQQPVIWYCWRQKKKIILRQNKVSSMMQFTHKSRGLFSFILMDVLASSCCSAPAWEK